MELNSLDRRRVKSHPWKIVPGCITGQQTQQPCHWHRTTSPALRGSLENMPLKGTSGWEKSLALLLFHTPTSITPAHPAHLTWWAATDESSPLPPSRELQALVSYSRCWRHWWGVPGTPSGWHRQLNCTCWDLHAGLGEGLDVILGVCWGKEEGSRITI